MLHDFTASPEDRLAALLTVLNGMEADIRNLIITRTDEPWRPATIGVLDDLAFKISSARASLDSLDFSAPGLRAPNPKGS